MTSPRRLIELDVALSLALDVRAPAAGDTFHEVREVAREELEPLLRGAPSLARPLASLDAAAPGGWRCFVAFDGGAPVHVSFVDLRPGRPLLFGCVTEAAARGHGAFRATVARVAATLASGGATRLWSATTSRNPPSVRAHAAAGFAIVGRHYDVLVRGQSVRGLARRILRRGRRRKST